MATGDWEKAFVEALEWTAGKAAQERILGGLGGLADSAEGASWVRGAVARLDRDLDPLVSFLNEKNIAGGGLRRDGDTIYAVYDRCYCPRVSSAPAPISPTYCHCSRGWLGSLFAALLGREVEVELLASILGGASTCRFAVRPVGR